MANRQRLLSVGKRRGERICREFGEAVRDARLGLGITQRHLGAAVGVSDSEISRVERAAPPHPTLLDAARIAAAVGLDLAVRCYPNGSGLRDEAQLQLVGRLVAAAPLIAWSLEEVIPLPGDLRAWDAVGRLPGTAIGVTAETRLRDAQALLRRENAKLRDSEFDLLILLLLGSRANRATLRQIRESLRPELPLDTREILSALRRGRSPGASGIVLL